VTPLAHDVQDVIETEGSVGYLSLLRPRTKLGAELAKKMLDALTTRLQRSTALDRELRKAKAEVEGLRDQNAKLTEALQRAEDELGDARTEGP